MNSDKELEETLDYHGGNYADITKNFIIGKLTEDERNIQWKAVDRISKQRLNALIEKKVREAKQEPVGDAIEVDVPLETMKFVLSKIKAKPKTIADRLLMQEWQVARWFDGTADKYDLEVYIWRLKILARLTRKYNWAIFLLQPENLPGKKLQDNQPKGDSNEKV